MEQIDKDARAYIFGLVGEAGRVTCCSVSSRWNSYAISVSVAHCKQPHLYTNPGDPAGFNAEELAAMFGDFHLLCRLKPKLAISTYTACAGGSVQVAIFTMIANGMLARVAGTDTIILDPAAYDSVLNGAFRSGNQAMIKLARLLTRETDVNNIRWNPNDIIHGGVVDEWLDMVKPLPFIYSGLFASACVYGDITTVTDIYNRCIAAGKEYELHQSNHNDEMMWKQGNLDDHETEQTMVAIPIDILLRFVGLPQYMLVGGLTPQTIEHDDIRTYQNIDHRRFSMVKFNMSEILAHGIKAAVHAKRVDVLHLIIGEFTDTQLDHDCCMDAAGELASFDDVEYFKQVCETNLMPASPFSQLLLMATTDCRHIIRYLIELSRDDPDTVATFNGLVKLGNTVTGSSVNNAIELALLNAIVSNNKKTIKTILSEYVIAPTTRQLNLYMSYACANCADVEYFRRLGATMCACGNTHR